MLHHADNPLLLWCSVIIPLGVLYSAVYGPEAALFCDLFDAKVRYTGISFVYQFSGIFASGLTPIIATYLLKTGNGEPWHIVGYILFASLVSAVSVAMIGKGGSQSEGRMKTAHAR
jgi:MHS family shikimate/dehydroshikimate transporter-like MFS transporter